MKNLMLIEHVAQALLSILRSRPSDVHIKVDASGMLWEYLLWASVIVFRYVVYSIRCVLRKPWNRSSRQE